MIIIDYTKPETLSNMDLAFALADENESHHIKFGYTGGASLYADLIREAAWRITHDKRFSRKAYDNKKGSKVYD